MLLGLCSMEAAYETIAMYLFFLKHVFDHMFPVTLKETNGMEKGDNSLLLQTHKTQAFKKNQNEHH